jgi:hypothetical protein
MMNSNEKRAWKDRERMKKRAKKKATNEKQEFG